MTDFRGKFFKVNKNKKILKNKSKSKKTSVDTPKFNEDRLRNSNIFDLPDFYEGKENDTSMLNLRSNIKEDIVLVDKDLRGTETFSVFDEDNYFTSVEENRASLYTNHTPKEDDFFEVKGYADDFEIASEVKMKPVVVFSQRQAEQNLETRNRMLSEGKENNLHTCTKKELMRLLTCSKPDHMIEEINAVRKKKAGKKPDKTLELLNKDAILIDLNKAKFHDALLVLVKSKDFSEEAVKELITASHRVQRSKKEKSEEMHKLGMLPKSISDLKDKAAKERKEKLKREYQKNRIQRTKTKIETTQFREVTGAEIDARLKIERKKALKLSEELPRTRKGNVRRFNVVKVPNSDKTYVEYLVDPSVMKQRRKENILEEKKEPAMAPKLNRMHPNARKKLQKEKSEKKPLSLAIRKKKQFVAAEKKEMEEAKAQREDNIQKHREERGKPRISRAQRKGLKKMRDSIVTESFVDDFDFIPVIEAVEVLQGVLTSEYFQLASSIACFGYQVYRSRNTADLITAFYQFIQAVDLQDRINDLKDGWLRDIADITFVQDWFSSRDELKIETEALSDYVNKAQGFIEGVFTSELISAMSKLIMAAVSMKWFPTNIAKQAINVFGKPTKMTIVELICNVLQSIGKLLQCGEAFMSGAPFSEILMGSDPVGKFLSEAKEALLLKDRTYTGLPTPGYVDRNVYRAQLQKLIETGDALLKNVSMFETRKARMKEIRTDLFMVACDIDSKQRSQNRVPPAAVVLYGDPGIGKSHLLKLIARVWSSVKGREFSEDQIYSRSKTSEYWEGYLPYSHPFIHYSEVGNESAELAKRGLNTTLAELNSLIDGLPFSCDMAFDDKGKVYANPDLVLIDTNNKEMNMQYLVSCPAAIKRRFIFVNVAVLPEYQKGHSTAIDYAKSLEAGGDLMDRYEFTITTYNASGRDSLEDKHLSRKRLPDMVRTLGRLFDEHIRKNQAMYDVDLFSNIDTYLQPLGNVSVGDNKIGISSIEESEVLLPYEEKGYEPEAYDYNEEKGDVPDGFQSESLVGDTLVGVDLSVVHLYVIAVFWFLLGNLVSLASYISEGVKNVFCFSSAKMLLALLLYLSFCCLTPLHCVFIGFVLLSIKPSLYFKLLGRYARYSIVNWGKRKAYESQCFLRHKVINPFENFSKKKEAKMLFGAATLFSVTVLGYVWYKRSKKEYRSETEVSKFLNVDENDEKLNEIEQLMGCNLTRRRVKTSVHQSWNVIEKPVDLALFKGEPVGIDLIAQKNMRRVRVHANGKTNTTNLLGIQGTYCVINTHSLLGANNFEIEYDIDLPVSQKIPIGESDFVDCGNDVTVINLKLKRFKNILKHVTNDGISQSQGSILGRPVRLNRLDNTIYVSNSVLGKIPFEKPYLYNTKHGVGMCGAALVAKVDRDGSSIVGIHGAGDTKSEKCFAIPLCRNQLSKAIEELKGKSPYLDIASEGDINVDTEVPIRKSPFVHEEFANLTYYGKIPGPVCINKRSRLIQNDYFESFTRLLNQEFKYEQKETYSIPMMQPIVKSDGTYISPYNIGLRKMNKHSVVLDSTIMGRVIEELTDHICSGLHELNIDKITPITILQAINGVEDDPFISRMNAAASGAFGYPGPKSKYLPFSVEPQREPVSDLRRRLAEIYSVYAKGDTCNFIYTAQLKDEPRTIEKCKNGGTRLFYMCPLDGLIVSRALLSPFYSLMVENNDVFCTAVGINMHTQADDLYAKMTRFSPHIIEGDYAGFDVNNPVFIAQGVNTVIYNVCQRLGYSEYSLRILKGVLSDNLVPFININQDLFSKMGLQPSGKYGTAEDNSMRGLVMLMYAYYAMDGPEDRSFFRDILPLTYGDDVLVSVKPHAVSWFNGVSYSKACLEFYNMEFTTASKSKEIPEFITMDDASFLKRNFIYSPIYDRIVAPLNLDSINKSIQWSLISSHVTEEMQVLSTFQSMLWELSFHVSNEAQFDVFRSFFKNTLKHKYQGGDNDYILPSLREIVERVVGNGKFEYEFTGDELVTESLPLKGGLYSLKSTNVALKDICVSQPRHQSVLTDVSENVRHARTNEERERTLFNIRSRVLSDLDKLHELLDQYEGVEYCRAILKSRHTYHGYHRMLLNNEVVAMIEHQECLKATLAKIDHILAFDAHPVSESMDEGEVKAEVENVNENVFDIVGDTVKEGVSGLSYNMHFGNDEALQLQDFFRRPVEIANTTISVGSYFNASYPLWDILSKQPSVRAKLRNYAYLHADLHVRVTVSGTPFHMGRLLISYQPYPNRNVPLQALLARHLSDATALDCLLNYLSQSDGSHVLDVRLNKPIEIQCPYISTKPMHRLFNTSTNVLAGAASFTDLAQAGSLFVYSTSAINAATTNATPVAMQIVAWLENVSLGCTTATQLEIITESDEREQGPVERWSTSAAVFTDALSKVPSISGLMKASTMVLRGFAGVASWFGWSRPIIIDDPVLVKNRPYANSAWSIGSSTTEKISFDPKQELTIDGLVCASQKDDLVLKGIYERMSYLTHFEWEEKDPVMSTPLFTCKVHPNLDTVNFAVTEGLFQPTAMSFAASPFQYWRGSIIFRLDILASKFHRGKLAIFYEPNINQATLINADIALNKNFLCLVDIQETQTIDLCIDWAQPRPWNRTLPPGMSQYNYDNFDPTQYAEEYCNGYISVVPFTELQSPDGSNVEINVYVAGKELQFNFLSEQNLPSRRHIEIIEEEFKTESEMNVDVSCVELNKVHGNNVGSTDYYFGEQVLSFRSALKRFVTSSRATFTASAAAQGVTINRQSMLPARPQIGSTASDVTLLEYLPYAYLGVRGSVRKRISFITPEHSGSLDKLTVSLQDPASAISSAYGALARTPGTFLRGSVQYVPHTNGGVEFDIPFYSNNLFNFSFANNWIGTNGTGDMAERWVKGYTAEYATPLANGDNVYFTEETAAGEDFTFMRFIAAPPYSTAPP